eukprot:5242636-Lingulodinium_polyedra.AAC.1
MRSAHPLRRVISASCSLLSSPQYANWQPMSSNRVKSRSGPPRANSIAPRSRACTRRRRPPPIR